MSFITVPTIKDGRVALLVSVDNYSRYCWILTVKSEHAFEHVAQHISELMAAVNRNHPQINPLFVMAYGKDFIPKLEDKFPKAKFMFNPVLADEIAMPEARRLMKGLSQNG